mgnify:CR=1 FL=1
MYRSQFYELAEDDQESLVWLIRSPAPYRTAGEVRAEVDAIVRRFQPRHRDFGIIVDMRDAPPRNDPDFEAAMRQLRFSVGRAFARVAVLVATASGEMQVSRLHREGHFVYHVTRDPDEAHDLAAGRRSRPESGFHGPARSSSERPKIA